MRRQIIFVLLLFLAIPGHALNTNAPAIIPAPRKMEVREGVFQLSSNTCIVADEASKNTGTYLAGKISPSTGYQLPIKNGIPKSYPGNMISLIRDDDVKSGSEGYELDVASDSVTIRASTQAGLFYGVQSLLQLLSPEIFSPAIVTNVSWQIPCVHIADQPRFQWRGFMLDVSRHFFNKAEIKRVLDLMALHKENTFHWHLADDQGWRIEIRKYPRLTEIGAWRAENGFGLDPKSTTAYNANGKYGGFYTQSDIREIVAYAAARHITIVPEIEMPGHETAALAAYPELSCFGGPYTPETKGGIFNGVYCAGNDKTFEFLQDVLTEVFELFPGKVIHIGGDEVPKNNWQKCPLCQARMKQEGLKSEHELQSYFIRRIEKFVTAKGRTLMGWSEIREGGLAQNAAIMDWIGGGLEAAKEGHDVVMTPTDFCYFDHYQALDQAIEPKASGDYLSLRKVYSFEPIPAGLPAELQAHILGGQANLWTEYVPSIQQVEYMMFPRLCALAEVDWSPQEFHNEEDFNTRLQIHNLRLDQLKVNYRRDLSVKIGEWIPAQITTTNKPGVTLEWNVTPHLHTAGQYRVTFEPVSGTNGLSIASAALLENGKEISRDTHNGIASDLSKRVVYVLELPTVKPDANYTLRATAFGIRGTNSQGTVSWVVMTNR